MRGISAMNKKALAYFQSGGPTTVINSSLYGVIAEAFKHPEIGGVYGSLYGVEGLIDDNLVDLRKEDLEQIELLKQTPGAALGSSRKKLPGVEDPLFAKIIDTIERRNIGYLLVNGGNDTMDTCFRLDSFFKDQKMDVKVIGIPKTIDNDLMATDHCPGYASAARHVLNFVKMAVVDGKAYRRGKIVLVEIMGRNAGWLTASADLLAEDERPDLIYLPESPFSLEGFLKDVKEVYGRKGYAVVVLSEGLDLPRKNAGGTDSFGHSSLEGVSIHGRVRKAGNRHRTFDGFDKNPVTSFRQGDCVGGWDAAAVCKNEFACLFDCDRLLRRRRVGLIVLLSTLHILLNKGSVEGVSN